MKSQHQLRVEEFMRQAGQEIPSEPTIPSEEVRLLRVKLILEEVVELAKKGYAMQIIAVWDGGRKSLNLTAEGVEFSFLPHPTDEPNLIEIADGHADISVTNVGGMSACGIQDKELLEEVDRSNLAKFEIPKCDLCGSVMTLQGYDEPPGTYACSNSRCIASRNSAYFKSGPYQREDGKWIKGPNWQPPDIAGVLARQKIAGVGVKGNLHADSGTISVIEDDGACG